MNPQQGNYLEKYTLVAEKFELPSKGRYYPKVDNELVSYVMIKPLVGEDEEILLSQTLANEGKTLDILLERKVESKIPVSEMITADRIAILIQLRCTIDHIYTVTLKDPSDGKPFDYPIDLTKLKTKDVTAIPNEDGHFDFILPKSGKRVYFRMLNARDEANIKKRILEQKRLYPQKANLNIGTILRLEQLVVSIEGIDKQDWQEKELFLRRMPMKDTIALRKYIEEVTPMLDLSLNIVAPSGARFRRILPITSEFLFPSS